MNELFDCRDFRGHLHERAELSATLSASFEGHARRCPPCEQLLVESQRLDDLLLSWAAPATEAELDREVARCIVDGPGRLDCETARGMLLDRCDDLLGPWEQAPLDVHLEECAGCRDEWLEWQEAQTAWRSWDAPEPPAQLADQVLARLAVERTVSSSPLRWLNLNRAVAALLLVGVGLLASRWLPVSSPTSNPGGPSSLETATGQQRLPAPVPAPLPTREVSYRVDAAPGPAARPGSFDPTQRFYHQHPTLERKGPRAGVAPRKGHLLIHLLDH